MGMQWYGDKCKDAVSKESRKRIHNAAIYWVRHAKNRMGAVGKASNEGTYPYKQTGHLRRNVTYELHTTQALARVGTNVKYGRYLEQGTRTMAARPWMTLTNMGTQTAIKTLIQTGTTI